MRLSNRGRPAHGLRLALLTGAFLALYQSAGFAFNYRGPSSDAQLSAPLRQAGHTGLTPPRAVAGVGLVFTWEAPRATSAGAGAQQESEEGEGRRGLILKIVNVILLVGALVFLLRKPLNSFLATRSQAIREGLEEGRKALEESRSRLNAIEEKLSRLQEEIEKFKAAAATEVEAERERLLRTAAEDAEKIMQSARAQIETSARAAKLELKVYAADRALHLAEEMLRQRLDDAGQHHLVERFVTDVKNGGPSKG